MIISHKGAIIKFVISAEKKNNPCFKNMNDETNRKIKF